MFKSILSKRANAGKRAVSYTHLAKKITDELANNEEYAFLREGSEFEELMAQLRD